MKPRRIYLDSNATTPVDPRVIKVVCEILSQIDGNPSSIHSFGREARAVLNKARDCIAGFLNIRPNETIFTSGGTEGVNLVLRGFFSRFSKGHIITSAIEHACVYTTVECFREKGWDVTYLPVGAQGNVDPEDVKAALRPDTRLIALMAVNNETGVFTDIEKIAAIAQLGNIPFFVDGVAWLGKDKVVIPPGVSAMSFSGHKIHAPKGVGVVYIQHKWKLEPQLTGGEQEFQRRGGTENLAAIAGMAEAVRLLQEDLPEAMERMASLRDRLETEIRLRVPQVMVNGTGPRICNTTNLAFLGLEGETLLTALDMEGVAVSHGSACSSGALEPSRVLLKMGLSRAVAGASLRFSLSRMTTAEDIDQAIEIVCKIASRLRGY
jgi:cysteine desulfurase